MLKLYKSNCNIKTSKHIIYNTTQPNVIIMAIVLKQPTLNTTTSEAIQANNPTQELIHFLIDRNREDAKRFKLTHFKNIRCKDNNNKSCIIPIYKTPENREELNEAERSNLLIQTINYKYAIFIRDIYNITYKDLLNRMDARYKINVGLFKE